MVVTPFVPFCNPAASSATALNLRLPLTRKSGGTSSDPSASNGGMVVTCGSNRLLKLLQQLGKELGIRGQVALEQHMACGIGSCFCCVRSFRKLDSGELEYRKVCQAGPVFDLQEAVSW